MAEAQPAEAGAAEPVPAEAATADQTATTSQGTEETEEAAATKEAAATEAAAATKGSSTAAASPEPVQPAAAEKASGSEESGKKAAPCGALSRKLTQIVTSKDPHTAAAKAQLLVGDDHLRVMLEMQGKSTPPVLHEAIAVELQTGSRMQLLVPLDRLCALGDIEGIKSLRAPKSPSAKSGK